MFTVEKSEWLDDWYVLSGCGWVCVEGKLSEWQAVAEAIRKGKSVYFRRLACMVDSDGFTFWSPRNASGPEDRNFVSSKGIPALLQSIDALLDTAAGIRGDQEIARANGNDEIMTEEERSRR